MLKYPVTSSRNIEYAITRYEKEILSEMLEELNVKDRDINLELWDGKVRGAN